ncbi:unnamed protein product (macronuclear) [Paramecium tetraurelia]|uniref:Mic1 domain-containing protein n=1 Tax=Paramecium tetraurelia TaxID=5888 RepID=A0D8F6_PARTE|nr:uncharacterized protein GSPATT00014269001 [Paramecium tetraurelia]CAK79323.1 unnamed protein product [Paramecium tetraurelia]|eukprot:XP_001446720.1 hypothetical protein (macronuclear) [Paramecium tetraurelia strain d4-2]
MSLAQFIQYNQQTFLNEFWKTLRPESQLFYDRGNEIFIFREQNQIFIIQKSQPTTVVRIQIPYNQMIHSMNIQQDYTYVAYQVSENQLKLFSTRANRQFTYQVQQEKNSYIIQFEWAKGSLGIFDIMVVENHGIHLLKIDDQVKKVKFLQQKITCCWYELKNEVLATCCSNHNGLISTYFFKEKKKDFKYKGPEVYLDDFESKDGTSPFASIFKSKKTDIPLFIVPTDKKNKDLCQDELISDSIYRVYLIHIYGKSLLAFSNSYSGKLLFYQLQYEKITKQKYLLNFPSDITINLSVIDNLIILSTFNEKFSQVFDVKKQRPESALGAPQSIFEQQEISTIKFKDVEKQHVVHQHEQINEVQQNEQTKKSSSRSLEDSQNDRDQAQKGQSSNKQLDSDEKADDKNIEDNKLIKQNIDHQEVDEIEQQEQSKQTQQIQKNEESQQFSNMYLGFDIQTLIQEIKLADEYYQTFLVKTKWCALTQHNVQIQSRIYEQSCNFLEDDLIINYKEKQIYQFTLNLKYLPNTFEDEPEEAFCGLLRRSNCKNAVFEFLIQLALNNKPIKIFQNIFEIFVRVFSEHVGHAQNERQYSGYTVLYPLDIKQHFFQVLAENENMNKQFLIEILIEFIRQFQELLKDYTQSIIEIQRLLIKLLIQTQRFTHLQFLIQYQVLLDNLEFAKQLIEISGKESLALQESKSEPYEPAYQLGLDMFFRLSKYEELLECLLKYGKFHDAAYLLNKIPNIRMRLPPIQEGIRNSDCQREDLLLFLEDAYKKQKTYFSVAEVKTL